MKLSAPRISTAMILALLVVSSAGCALVNKIRAKNELNETARSYREGQFDQAEQHAKRALELDPNNPTAPIFVARVVHQQYERNRDPKKGQEAIEAYRRVLEKDPDSEEAYKAISVLYAELKDDQKLKDWIAARANNSNLKPEKRAEAYAVLAGKAWDCSFRITEAPDVKVITAAGKAQVTYKKPKDPKDFEMANKCVIEGLENANKAIKLDPTNETAWSYLRTLYVEQAKLAEMDGNAALKAAAIKKAEEAGKREGALAQERAKREAEAVKSATPTQ
jgi:tetratricopeptide (TPR) repeat protein